MSAFEVADARTVDLEVLMAWREEVLRDVFELDADDDLSLVMEANRRAYGRSLADGTLLLCLAWPEGEPHDPTRAVATGALCLQEELPSPDNPQGSVGYLMNVYTREAWRGQGAARSVVGWLLAEAKRRDLGKVYLETTPAAAPLYRSLGFEPMEGYLKLGD